MKIIVVLIILAVSGCQMPQTIQFAPIATVELNDSANGNTVTPVAP